MNDQQLLRYSRHILLDDIGIEGQQRVLDAHALVIGVGGLGSPVAMYLAAAGVGRLTLCDGDTVELTNLQRQIAHTTASLGHNKAQSGAHTVAALNADTAVTVVNQRLDAAAVARQVVDADIVLDCSDNFATRHAINRACVAAGKPLVSGAAVRFDGQLSVFDPRQAASPCYHCLFPESGDGGEVACAQFGVFAPLVGVVGSLQAAEALKVLIGCGRAMVGRLLLIDGLSGEWRTVRLPRDPACPVCGS